MLKGTTLAVLLCALTVSLRAQSYFLKSEMINGVWGPPWPFNPCSSCPVYAESNDVYVVNDGGGSFSASALTTSDDLTPPGTNGIGTNYVSPMDLSYTTNGSLWIDAYSNDTQNIYLQLHNTTNSLWYQLWSATNLGSPGKDWTPGQFLIGHSDTNITQFPDPVPMTSVQTFFRGQQASTVIFNYWQADAYETNATLGIAAVPGRIDLDCIPTAADPLTVYYNLGGTARSGTDYTNLSGVATIPGGQGYVSVYIQPIDPSTLTNPVETAVITVLPNTNYLVSPDQNSAVVYIKSSTTTVSIYSGDNTDAVRPVAPGQPGRDGIINIYRNDNFGNVDSPLSVYYQISGTASNGVDYQLLSNSVTFAAGSGLTNVTIVPFAESPPPGTKSVTVTLISTNGYVVDSNNYSGTINIYDQTNIVSVSGDTGPAINLNGPPGAPVQADSFYLTRSEPQEFYPETTVYYSMSGDAVNGVDYAALTGTVTFPENEISVSVPIEPISSWTNTSKAVILALLPGYYVIDTNNAIATNEIDNSSTEVSVSWQQDAVQPYGTNAAQPGYFTVQRSDTRGFTPALSVQYRLTGSATNGVDYTNLSGIVTFAAGPSQTQTNIYIQPLTTGSFPGDKSVFLSLLPTNSYFIDTNNAVASLAILDNNIQFQTVTNLAGGPVGIDYDPYLTNLIVSGGVANFQFNRFGTNITVVGGSLVTNLFITNWSGIGGLPDEVYNIVVTNNASGFTNGDMFFGSDTGIGWLSSNAAASNLNWCVLTNATETNALLLRGAMCMDTTGSFSNNLIAVTSSDSLDYGTKGVWEVDSQGNPTLLADIDAELLEGVTVVRTNFGPWSQKIITGDEGSVFLYTVDTNKTVTTNDSTTLFPGGIRSESITAIPANQSLYMCDPTGSITKLSKNYFTNYVGDLLIEDGGENRTGIAKLFIIHWDTASTNFITHRIRYNYGGRTLEHCSFAPIELPAH
jgi:hypothetical protein